MRSALCSLILLFSASALGQVNPATNIVWPQVTGHGAPGSPDFICSPLSYGMPYLNLDVLPNAYYVCGDDGWVIRGGSSVPGGGIFVPSVGGSWSIPSPLDPTGATDNSAPINASIISQISSGPYATASLFVPPGKFYTPSLSNIYGVPVVGSGTLLKSVTQTSTNNSGANVTATKAQQNSYAYAQPRLVFGMEYLSHWMSNIESSAPTKMIFSGDSTTSGVNVSSPFTPDQMFLKSATQAGITALTVVNAGHVAKDTADWLSSYLAADLAASPDVYVVRWGTNDPFYGLSLATTIANIRSGLATIRAASTVDQMTVVLEMPSSSNDNPNGRNRAFYEQLRNGLAQAARDYQAVFIDLYALMPDNDFAVQTCMMDLPYAGVGTSTPPIHIHAGDCKNPIYNELFARTLLDPLKIVLPSPGGTTYAGPLFNVPITTLGQNGVYVGVGTGFNNGGSMVISNQSAPTDQKYWQWYEDSLNGDLDLLLVNDAVSISTKALQMSRSGINFTGLRYLGNAPCFAFRDNAGTADIFFGAFTNVGQFGVNRNPCTGNWSDTSKTAATMQINATANGTSSNMKFLFSATAFSVPTLAATFDNTGMDIPTGENYKINGVPIGGPGTRNWSCQPGYGMGDTAIPAGTKLTSTCYNDTGSTITLTSIGCFTDNAGTSTMNAANTTGTLLSSSPLTCTGAFAGGTLAGGNHTLLNGDYIRFTFVADGTTKQANLDVGGTY
jgi:hypothetical protein